MVRALGGCWCAVQNCVLPPSRHSHPCGAWLTSRPGRMEYCLCWKWSKAVGKPSFFGLAEAHQVWKVWHRRSHFPRAITIQKLIGNEASAVLCSPNSLVLHELIIILQPPRPDRGSVPCATIPWCCWQYEGSTRLLDWSCSCIALLHSEGGPAGFPDISSDLSQFGAGHHHSDPLGNRFFAVFSCIEVQNIEGACLHPELMTGKTSTWREKDNVDWFCFSLGCSNTLIALWSSVKTPLDLRIKNLNLIKEYRNNEALTALYFCSRNNWSFFLLTSTSNPNSLLCTQPNIVQMGETGEIKILDFS